jgi:hypothetical protein
LTTPLAGILELELEYPRFFDRSSSLGIKPLPQFFERNPRDGPDIRHRPQSRNACRIRVMIDIDIEVLLA